MNYKKWFRLSSLFVATTLATIGFILFVAGNSFQSTLLNVDIDSMLASVGALLLIIGVLQWLFDTAVRHDLIREIRSEVMGGRSVAESGIADFHPDSTKVDFSELFLSSKSLTIGVNYSAKIVDNSISLIKKRCDSGHNTTIIVLNANGNSAKFLESQYNAAHIAASIEKIKSTAKDCDEGKNLIVIKEIDTILRYSFVEFDSRIWIVMGTNGKGRRAVPGFFVRLGSPWFLHFKEDIDRVLDRKPVKG